MPDYDISDWSDLFVAAAGAAAALTGLLFVAVSINLKEIIEDGADRALQTLLLLLSVVIVSLFGLAPDQSIETLGVELAVIGAVVLVASAWAIVRSPVAEGAPSWFRFSWGLLALPGPLFYLVGGVSLIAGSGGGLGWVLAGIVSAILGGVVNAWVLLVEILR